MLFGFSRGLALGIQGFLVLCIGKVESLWESAKRVLRASAS